MTPKELYDKYGKESYSNSFDHGFWEDKENRNRGEMVMLIINEVGECQEAYRSGNHIESSKFYLSYDKNLDGPFDIWYKENVKGSTGEELADIVIRIFDYIVGWDIPLGFNYDFKFYTSGNFSSDLLTLVSLINGSMIFDYWNDTLSGVIQFSKVWDINLEWQIVNKQAYNRTRPYKHGKLF